MQAPSPWLSWLSTTHLYPVSSRRRELRAGREGRHISTWRPGFVGDSSGVGCITNYEPHGAGRFRSGSGAAGIIQPTPRSTGQMRGHAARLSWTDMARAYNMV